MRNFNENGRSMVEMLGVLAIIGVLSAGGLAGYSKAMFKHKLNTTMEQITMLVTNIRTMYGTQRNYKDLSLSQARSLGILPASIGTGNKNPFKGSIDITTVNARADAAAKLAKAETTTPTGFAVTYGGLPAEACIALATADFGSGAGSGFISVGINGLAEGLAVPKGFIGTNEGEAYDMSTAITQCNLEATKENNTITWYFY